jgi:hypothetical protein
MGCDIVETILCDLSHDPVVNSSGIYLLTGWRTPTSCITPLSGHRPDRALIEVGRAQVLRGPRPVAPPNSAAAAY